MGTDTVGRIVLRILFFISQGSRSFGSWLHFLCTVFHLLFFPSLFSEIIIKCVKGLSPIGDPRCQGYTKTLATSLSRSYTMSTPSSGPAGNGAGGEGFHLHGDLGGISEIQQQLSVLSRQMEQLASRFTDSGRQRAEEAANAAIVQAAQKIEEERRKRREVQEWKARIFSLHAVQRALEGRSATTAVGSTADKRQEQGDATGYVQRTEPS